MNEVFMVYGYDVGGNTGNVVVRVFANEADAEWFAVHAKQRKWNGVFDVPGGAFDVEAEELVGSLAEIAAELSELP